MPIRFEIKPQIIEFLVEEIGFDDFGADDAQVLIEQLMGLMMVHKCIICPTPDAALVEALRRIAAGQSESGGFWLSAKEMQDIARAALASVEQGGE